MPQPTAAAPVSPPDSGPPSTIAARIRWLLSFALGAGLLAFLLSHTDIDEIHQRFADLGARSPLVLLPYLLIAWFDARGWRCTFPPAVAARVPIGAFYLIRMAGEAVNSLTPTATVGGEPLKAHLLRRWDVSHADGLASIVIAKTTLTISQIAFILIGLSALFARLGRPLWGVLWLTLNALVAFGFMRMLVRMQRREPVSAVWRFLKRFMPRARFLERLESGARAIDQRLGEFYRFERGPFVRAILWHLSGWLTGVLEVSLMMALIGAPISLGDALLIEALAQPIRGVALFIPGGLGLQEAGGVVLCTWLGIPEPIGLSLWLLKRGREFVFDGVGLGYLAYVTWWRRTPVAP
jgi:putative membrane protein